MQEYQQPKILSVKLCGTAVASENGFDEDCHSRRKKDILEQACVVSSGPGEFRERTPSPARAAAPCLCHQCVPGALALQAFPPVDLPGRRRHGLPWRPLPVDGWSSRLLTGMVSGPSGQSSGSAELSYRRPWAFCMNTGAWGLALERE